MTRKDAAASSTPPPARDGEDTGKSPAEGLGPSHEQVDIGAALEGLMCSMTYLGRLGIAFISAMAAYHLLDLTHNAAVREIDAAAVSFLVLAVGFAMCFKSRREPPPLPESVRQVFRVLSGLELTLTVILPLWVLGSREFEEPLSPCNLLLSSHLFVFLSQIFAESLIACSGKGRRYLMLPTALVWNVYRAFPLWAAAVHAVEIVRTEEPPPLICFFCHAVSVALWVYSTFFFILRLWMPHYAYPPPLPPLFRKRVSGAAEEPAAEDKPRTKED